MKILTKLVLLFQSNDLIIKNVNNRDRDFSLKYENENENINNDDYDDDDENIHNYDNNYNNDNDDGDNHNDSMINENENENENEIFNKKKQSNQNVEENEEIKFIKIYSWNGNPDFIVSLLPDLSLFPSNYIQENTENENESNSENETLDMNDDCMLTQIFLDIENSSILLGEEICYYLNNKLNHEAVDYIQEMEYKNIVCINFLVTGEALPQILELVPPMISIAGQMSLGRTYKGTYDRRIFLILNCSADCSYHRNTIELIIMVIIMIIIIRIIMQ